MKNHEETYQKLKKQYTDKEIAQSMIVPNGMNAVESDEEFRKLREQLSKNKSPQERMRGYLLGLKYAMEDVIEAKAYNPQQNFSKFLKEYMSIVGRKQKYFAKEIDLHPTKLSRILNEREDASISIAYRLEAHSANLIPAVVWWKLVIKKQEYMISQDLAQRNKEAARVSNTIQIG